jgi:hypothetical protein
MCPEKMLFRDRWSRTKEEINEESFKGFAVRASAGIVASYDAGAIALIAG